MTGALAPADLILRSGAIHTMDARGRVVEALAAAGGRIVAVGTDRDVLRHRGPRTKVVDLRGRFACPGFIDCHTHFAKRALGITRVGGGAGISGRGTTDASDRFLVFCLPQKVHGGTSTGREAAGVGGVRARRRAV